MDRKGMRPDDNTHSDIGFRVAKSAAAGPGGDAKPAEEKTPEGENTVEKASGTVPGPRAARSKASAVTVAGGLRYVGYTLYGPASAVDEIAPYTNVVLDGSWIDKGPMIAEKAHKAGLKVVLHFGSEERNGIENVMFPFIKKHHTAVSGVAWSSPYYHHYTAQQVEQFGRALKAKFPRLQYWVCNVEKPRGRDETQPIPPSVDVVVVDGYYDKSPDGVRRKMDGVLPGWLAKAQGRPLMYRWYSWNGGPPGSVRQCTPGTMQACFDEAAKFGLSGVLFWKYGSESNARNAGMDGINANPTLVQEIRNAAGKLGISNGGERR
jgi:hypothetical protein